MLRQVLPFCRTFCQVVYDCHFDTPGQNSGGAADLDGGSYFVPPFTFLDVQWFVCLFVCLFVF